MEGVRHAGGRAIATAIARELGLAHAQSRSIRTQVITIRRPEQTRGLPVWEAVGQRSRRCAPVSRVDGAA